MFQAGARPVSGWLVDAIEPQPGHRVLELAAGPGDTGLLAAELVAPGGTLISTDAAPEMVEARPRAGGRAGHRERRVPHDGRRVDRPADGDASTGDRALGLHAARRSGRRAARDAPRAASRRPRRARGVDGARGQPVGVGPAGGARSSSARCRRPTPTSRTCSPSAIPARIVELLEDAGFSDVVVDQLDLVWRYEDLDEWWDVQLDISTTLAKGVGALTPARATTCATRSMRAWPSTSPTTARWPCPVARTSPRRAPERPRSRAGRRGRHRRTGVRRGGPHRIPRHVLRRRR